VGSFLFQRLPSPGKSAGKWDDRWHGMGSRYSNGSYFTEGFWLEIQLFAQSFYRDQLLSTSRRKIKGQKFGL